MKTRWTFELLRLEALKYSTKEQFNKANPKAYLAATRREDYDLIVEHMPKRKDITGNRNPRFKWTYKLLKLEAFKYHRLGEFQKGSSSAYMTARKHKILKEISTHIKRERLLKENNPNCKWTYEALALEALRYDTLVEFQNKSSAAYQSAWNRGILKEIVRHMKPSHGSSMNEKEILKHVRLFFDKTQQFRTKRINIPNKPHIKMFEIDIYIPELRKGIEFDGEYWHSDKGLKRSRDHWPQEDIDNYHTLKDAYFNSIGIEILHIKEEEWKKNRLMCISKIEKFLGISGLMSNIESKVA